MNMRYFFDTLNGAADKDDIGQELATLDLAQDQAVLALVDMSRDEMASRKGNKVSVSVRDTTGKTVLTASLVLDIQRPT